MLYNLGYTDLPMSFFILKFNRKGRKGFAKDAKRVPCDVFVASFAYPLRPLRLNDIFVRVVCEVRG